MAYEQLNLSAAVPVLSWANHDLGADETKMAKNVASLPFVFKHVALMPDVHLGKGALVGSVVATKDAILPAAVGVDIGCFAGETLVPLVDGQSYPIQELAEREEFVVYACTTTGKVVAASATAKLTRRAASLVKVVLDNGEEIICTPDHQFMLRDGTYVEAQALQPETSLMPFYTRTDKDGYTLIAQPYSGKWQKAHWQAVAGNGKRGKQYLVQYNQSEKGRAKSQEIANRTYSCEICGAEVRTPIGLHNHRRSAHQCNHKVVAIMPLDYTSDVYCLTVPEHHNFALKAGVFVHNCGMSAIKLPFDADQLDGKLKQIRRDIEAIIPVGFNDNREIEKSVTNWQGWQDFKDLHPGVQNLEGKALKQMGSLGGGNHFIELCLDAADQVWLMLHSGSRNIGNMLAQRHIETAKELMKLSNVNLPDPELAYFVQGTEEFAAYWHDLQWAQDYAKFNRDVMMARFQKVVEKHLAGGKPTKPLLQVNCHHNYAEREVHYGESVYVTRKGAVRAREADYGIIPGSMGAKSFIVKGKGNCESYCSCSHGAGRLMSRNKAKKAYTLDDLIQQTAGIECRKDEDIIDEIPAAYKPIEQVMANQSDLVEVVATLKQVVCVKG
jgi:tRNA-splicing ligase RtcB (3'-phosphate/5'-hydroxy nucleic acid ligase)